MAKPYSGEWIFRTVLFVPGHIDKMLEKGASTKADCVVLDLEDAVPNQEKTVARQKIRKTVESGIYKRKTLFVRINPIDTGLTLMDLEGVACQYIHGFVYPMANTPDDIKNFDAQLRLIENHIKVERGHFSIIALIETPLGVLNAHEIAKSSDRVVGLLFGCEDYFAELQGRYSENDTSLLVPRSLVAIAARAAGVVPIDAPYVMVHDLEGMKLFADRARDIGMAGMLVMSPKQIAVANEIYTPSPEEVQVAESIVKAAEEAEKEGRGIVIVNGNFVSPPTLKASKNLLAHANSIRNLEEYYG